MPPGEMSLPSFYCDIFLFFVGIQEYPDLTHFGSEPKQVLGNSRRCKVGRGISENAGTGLGYLMWSGESSDKRPAGCRSRICGCKSSTPSVRDSPLPSARCPVLFVFPSFDLPMPSGPVARATESESLPYQSRHQMMTQVGRRRLI